MSHFTEVIKKHYSTLRDFRENLREINAAKFRKDPSKVEWLDKLRILIWSQLNKEEFFGPDDVLEPEEIMSVLFVFSLVRKVYGDKEALRRTQQELIEKVVPRIIYWPNIALRNDFRIYYTSEGVCMKSFGIDVDVWRTHMLVSKADPFLLNKMWQLSLVTKLREKLHERGINLEELLMQRA